VGSRGTPWREKRSREPISAKPCIARSGCRGLNRPIWSKAIIDTVAEAVVTGDRVKLSSFGTFMVRDKGGRVGRNPKTGQEVPITPRRVLVFRPSQVMKSRINSGGGGEAQA
jgi:integration host factor alpha subunit